MRKITLPGKPSLPVRPAPAVVQPSAKLPAKPLAKPAARLPVRTPPNHANGVSAATNNGFDRARQQREIQEAEIERRKNTPFGFRMKVGEKQFNKATGKEEPGIELLILDNCKLPDLPFFHWYHRWGYQENVKGSGKEDVCLQETEGGCPICEELGQPGRWEMNLTVIDKRPYTPTQGQNAGKTIPMSRKLLTAKSKMIPHFEDLYTTHKKFRGMVVRVFRDGAKDEAIGSRVKFIRWMSEADIAKLPPDLRQPVDYKVAFPLVSRELLAARNKMANNGGGGGGAVVGGADFDSSDDIPF